MGFSPLGSLKRTSWPANQVCFTFGLTFPL